MGKLLANWSFLLCLLSISCLGFSSPFRSQGETAVIQWPALQQNLSTASLESHHSALRLADAPRGSVVTLRPGVSGTSRLSTATAPNGNETATQGAILYLHDAIEEAVVIGSPSHFTVDLAEVGYISGPIWIESTFEAASELELLIVRSESSDFVPLSIECESLETLTILGGPHNEAFLLGRLPEAFVGAVHIEGGEGDDSIDIIEEQSHYKGISLHHAALTIHKALVNTCPVSVNTPLNALTVSSLCECFLNDDISIIVNSLFIDTLGELRTEMGDIVVDATPALAATNGVEVRGTIRTSQEGDISLNGRGLVSGVDLGTGSVIESNGVLDITGSGRLNGIVAQGAINLNSLTPKTCALTGSLDILGVGPKVGVAIYPGFACTFSDYDVTISGTISSLFGGGINSDAVAVLIDNGIFFCPTDNTLAITGANSIAASVSGSKGGVDIIGGDFDIMEGSVIIAGDFNGQQFLVNQFGVKIASLLSFQANSVTINGEVSLGEDAYVVVSIFDSTITVTENCIIQASPSTDLNASGASGIDVVQSTLSAGTHIWMSLMLPCDSCANTRAVFISDSLIVSTSSFVSRIVGRGVDSTPLTSFPNLGNFGILLDDGASFFTGPSAMSLEGDARGDTYASSGVRAEGTIITTGIVQITGTGATGGSLSTMPNYGVDLVGEVIATGQLTIDGTVSGSGAAAVGQYGINFRTGATLVTNAPGAVLAFIGTGGSGPSSHGIQWSGMLLLTESAQITMTGNGGETSGFGVSIEESGSFPVPSIISVQGMGGGVASAVDTNPGIAVTASLNFANAELTLAGVGGGGAGSANNFGVVLTMAIESLVDIMIEGIASTTATGNGHHGVLIEFQGGASTLGALQIIGSASFGSSAGVFAAGPISGNAITIEGTTSSADVGATGAYLGSSVQGDIVSITGETSAGSTPSYGIHVDNANFVATTLTINGMANVNMNNLGLFFDSLTTTFTAGGTSLAVNLIGSGYIGVFFANSHQYQAGSNVATSILGTGSSLVTSGATGVYIAGQLIASDTVTIDGSATSTQDQIRGVTVDGSIFGTLVVIDGAVDGVTSAAGVHLVAGSGISASTELRMTGLVYDGSGTIFETNGMLVEANLILQSDTVIAGENMMDDTSSSIHNGVSILGDVTGTQVIELMISGSGGAVLSEGTGVRMPNFIEFVQGSVLDVNGVGNGVTSSYGVIFPTGLSMTCPLGTCSVIVSGTASINGDITSPAIDFRDVTSFGLSLVNVDGISNSAAQAIVVRAAVSNEGDNDLTMTATCSLASTTNCLLLATNALVLNGDTGDVILRGINPGSGASIAIQNGLGVYTPKLGGAYRYDGRTLYSDDITYVAGSYDIIYEGSLTVDRAMYAAENNGVFTFENINMMGDLTNGATLEATGTGVAIASGGTVFVSIGSVTISKPLTLFGNLLTSGVSVTDTVSFLSVDSMTPGFSLTTSSGSLFIDGNVGLAGLLSSVSVQSPGVITLRDGVSFVSTTGDQSFSSLVSFDQSGTVPTVTFLSSGGAVNFEAGTDDALGSGTSIVVDAQSISFSGVTAYAHRENTEFRSSQAAGVTSLNGVVFSLSPTLSFLGVMNVFASGLVNDVEVSADVILSPGNSPASTACLICDNIVLRADAQLEIDVNTATQCTGYDAIIVDDTVTIESGVNLLLASSSGPQQGSTFPIVLQGNAIPVTAFANLAEGQTQLVNGVLVGITYMGGAGNDVVITSNAAPIGQPDVFSFSTTSFTASPPGILSNDSDPDNQPSSIFVDFSSPLPQGEGAVTVFPDGSFMYTSGGFVGTTTFFYTISDGNLISDPITVTLVVSAIAPSISPTVSFSSTPSLSFSNTPSPSGTGTVSHTQTPSPSTTATAMSTTTATATASKTTTSSPTATTSASRTKTATPSQTGTPTSSKTATVTPSGTQTPTRSGMSTPTAPPSLTTTPSLSATPTISESATSSDSTSMSATETPSVTPSTTLTTSTTRSSSASPSVTVTTSGTPSTTVSVTQTPTVTNSASETPTPSKSTSVTVSPTGTATTTVSRTSSVSSTPSGSVSSTVSGTQSQSGTATTSKTSSISGTSSPTPTATMTSTLTPSSTESVSETASPTQSTSTTSQESQSPSATRSTSQTPSSGSSVDLSGSASMTATPSATLSGKSPSSVSRTATAEVTNSAALSTTTPTPSSLGTPTGTLSQFDSLSKTQSVTRSQTGSLFATIPRTPSPTPLVMMSLSATSSVPVDQTQALPPVAATAAATRSPSATVSMTRTIFGTFSVGLIDNNQAPNGSPIFNAPGSQPLATATLSDGSDNPTVIIRDAQGRDLGTVNVPDQVAGELVVTDPSRDVSFIPAIASSVIDVSIFDTSGNQLTSFNDDIEVCLTAEGVDEDDVCLGFFNDDNRWECQDYCLSTTDGQLCGRTDHLTNFALLLDSSAGSEDRCGSSSQDLLVVYLSVGAVALAMVVVIIGVILIEAKIRLSTWHTERKLTLTATGSAQGVPVVDHFE